MDFENFVHDDCDGLHREDKPYMTIILAYAAYGCHLRRTFMIEELQVSPQDIRTV